MKDLMNDIRSLAKFAAISDMPGNISQGKMKEVLETVNIEDYTIWQWSDAFTYIFGNRKERYQFEKYEEIMQFLPQEGESKE